MLPFRALVQVSLALPLGWRVRALDMGRTEGSVVDVLAADAWEEGEEPTERTAFPRVAPVGLFFGNFKEPRYLALCAEPAMGCSEVIDTFVAQARARHEPYLRRSLGELTAEAAAKAIARIVREELSVREVALVAIDDIPPADEACAKRIARGLRRAADLGPSIVISCAPEASQLLDELPEFMSVGARELRVRSDDAETNEGGGTSPLTRGVYCLEHGLRLAHGALCAPGALPRPYVDAYRELVSTSLRLTLTEEEVKLRLTMLLLGHGPCAELRQGSDATFAELLMEVRGRSPLFGIGEALDEYSCLGADSRELREASFSALTSAVRRFPEVGESCVEALCAREDFTRAAYVCKMLGTGDSVDVVLRNASRFIDVGECTLVGDALSAAELMGLGPDHEVQAAMRACEAVSSKHWTQGEQGVARAQAAVAGPEFEAQLLEGARALLCEMGAQPPFDARGWTPLARRLTVHADVCEKLSCGFLTSALRVLSATPTQAGSMSVSSALLEVDAELLRMLLGDGRAQGSERLSGALGLLSAESVAGLAGYADCLELVGATLRGDQGALTMADQVATRAERAGEQVVRAVALLARCAICLRLGAYAAAKAASELAVVQASTARAPYAGRVAEVLGEVARHLSGGQGAKVRLTGVTGDFEAVCAIVNDAMARGADGSARMAEGVGDELPSDALWVLAFLSDGLGDFSAALRERIPGAWLVSVARVRGSWFVEEEQQGERDVPALPSLALPAPAERATCPDEVRRTGWHGARRVEIALLGRFEVRVDGVLVPDKRLDRRNAKSVLVFLALQPGSGTKRYRIVEQVWPSSDYSTGSGRAYQATSVIRRALSNPGGDFDPLVTSRASKTVALNGDFVCCDVDDFRACAKATCDCEDSARKVALARAAERIYEGDLCVPPEDATGFVGLMRAELRRTYVDAMVAGAEAALRIGERHTSVRMATSAVLADNLREDAVGALVLALRACGRDAEAERQYQSFERRLAQRENRGPSSVLRGVMRDSEPRALD